FCSRESLWGSFNKKVEIRVRERFGRERVVPPFLAEVHESGVCHDRPQQAAVASRYATDPGVVRVRQGIEAIEPGSHVDAVIGIRPRWAGAAVVTSRRLAGLRLPRPDGHQRYVDGAAATVCGFLRDISARKELALRNRRVELRLHLLIAHICGPFDE